jgi:cobalt transporter subunit CbtA
MFRSIVFSAIVVGIVSGIAVSLMQMVGTTPLILSAETFESAGSAGHDHAQAPEAPVAAPPVAESSTAHSHVAGAAAHDHADGHDHGGHDQGGHDHGEGWTPADGLERLSYTAAANVLTAIGYALVLCGLLSVATQGGFAKTIDWRTGLFFGLAGFASVMLAPMVGLPPELPGSPAGDLGARQIWWLSTAFATALGIALLAFRRDGFSAVAAIALIAAPHVIGAPLPPEGEHALAPLGLERQFIVAATLTSLVFWALLGSLSGLLMKRFQAVR